MRIASWSHSYRQRRDPPNFVVDADLRKYMAIPNTSHPAATIPEASVIDTAEWLACVESSYGMHRVLALHPRSKADGPGRHLVSAANDTGEALVLLNSDGRRRRVHMGLGIWDNDSLLIGPSLPVQRRKGYRTALERLVAQRGNLGSLRDALMAWQSPGIYALALATAVSRDGCLSKAASLPAPLALVAGLDGSMLSIAFEVVRRMRVGRLAPRDRIDHRTEPAERPEDLFHVGTLCLDSALRLAKDAGKVPDHLDFGDILARRIRT
jgi:hypothetical protein